MYNKPVGQKSNKKTLLKTLMGVAIALVTFGPESGLNVGETVVPFHPHHVTGPNKGTDACPP